MIFSYWKMHPTEDYVQKNRNIGFGIVEYWL